jgi:hypothetical protein
MDKSNDAKTGLRRKILLWVLAVVLMLSAAYYQRRTGPSYPLRVTHDLGGEVVKARLIRTELTTEDAQVEVPAPEGAEGRLLFKRFGTDDPFSTALMEWKEGKLVGRLPAQPPAGKLEYHLRLRNAERELRLPADPEEQVVIRFKGDVPTAILLPHILFMFLAMLFGLRTALAVLFESERYRGLFAQTFVFLTLGGMILGPSVQKFAFGEFWTGWPNGKDLTDNKTLIMWLGWGLAGLLVLFFARSRPKLTRAAVLVATVVMLTVYLIPHSLRGSSLNYEALDRGVPAEEAIETGK